MPCAIESPDWEWGCLENGELLLDAQLPRYCCILRDTAASVFSSQGIASIAGRVLTTLLIRCGKVHIAAVMLSCYAIAQGSMFAGIFCNKFSEASQISLFLVHNILSGFGIGMYSVSLAPFLLSISGAEQLPTAFGYTNLINGLAGFVVMFIGKLADWYGVMAAFSVAAKLGIISITACIVAVIMIMWRERNSRTHQPVPMEAVLEKETSENV
uniref:MFS domain-containing protein n=1 Tax=Ascaris lumbricoides TaxID=6252 RepID=A0A0M3HYJ4_ASCLU